MLLNPNMETPNLADLLLPEEQISLSASPLSAGSIAPAARAHFAPHGGSRSQKYLIPILVMFPALAILITVTRNWNAWERGKGEEVTGAEA